MIPQPRSERLAFAALAAVVLVAAVLYFRGLETAPINVSTDEARFAVQAHALATTGRDVHGNRLPLFFLITNPLIANHSSVAWWQPTLFYMLAGVYRVVPLSAASTRLPIVCLALVNLVLIFFVARALFSNAWYGVLAAALLAMTPAHFILGRQAADYFCPLPIALVWIWCVTKCRHTGSTWTAGLTGLVLGVGLYSYITSWMVMPAYLVVTLGVLWSKPLKMKAALLAGFSIPLLPLAVWLWSHPEMPRDIFANYKVVTSLRIAERASLYWDYFNPSYLFFSGGSNLMWATRKAGIFPLAMAVLLPCGLWSIWKRGVPIFWIIVAAFLFAPAPIVAALPEAPQYATARHLLAVPYGVLIGIAGLQWLVTEGAGIGRVVAALLMLAVPVQFTMFVADYFSDYQLRSAFWTDAMNMRRVTEEAIAVDTSQPAPAVYLSEEDLDEDKVIKWRFHLIAKDRTDLWARTKYLSRGHGGASDVLPGSLYVLRTNNSELNSLVAGGAWRAMAEVSDVNGTPVATILRRN